MSLSEHRPKNDPMSPQNETGYVSSQLRDLVDASQWPQVRTILQSGLSIISCLFWRVTGRNVIGPRVLHDSFFYFPVKGRMWCRIGSTEGTIGPGQFMMAAEGVPHEARMADDCALIETFAMHVHLFAPQGQPLLGIFQRPIGTLSYPNFWYSQLRLLTCLAAEDQNLASRFGEPLLRNLLIEQVTGGNPLRETPVTDDPRMWLAVFTILRGIGGPPTVSGLARQAHLSEVQFRKLFRRYTGMAPKAYIRNVQLRKARALLQSSEFLTVKEIAARSGFATARHLHTTFKSAYGETPGACRKAAAQRTATADEETLGLPSRQGLPSDSASPVSADSAPARRTPAGRTRP